VAVEAVLAGADAALYEAKAGGRDQVRVGRAMELGEPV
jgi:PleD family two-component response regulator